MSTYWWLERRSYFLFILRELSSLFVAWSVYVVLRLVRAVSLGGVSYEAFLAWTRQPIVLVLNLVTLAFVVLHAVTWFNLAPKAMVVRLGGARLPGFVVAASNYAAWIVTSALLAWLLLGD